MVTPLRKNLPAEEEYFDVVLFHLHQAVEK